MQTAENQMTVIQRSAEVLKNGGQILVNNQERSRKALAVGENILKAIEANGGKLNEELDQRCQKYLANCGVALSDMKEARSGITQLMDELKKLYTEAENNIDPKKVGTIPAAIQVKRDEHARFVVEEEKRKRIEAEQKARIEKLKVEYKAAITTRIANCLINFLVNKKQQLNASFNAITLADFDTKQAGLRNLSVEFNQSKLGEVLKYDLPAGYAELDDIQKNTLRIDAHHEYDFKVFYSDYCAQITELKQDLIDRLPSKKAELEELRRLEEEKEKRRLAEIAAAEERERIRQEEIKKAAGREKKRLEEEARQAAAAELKRQQEQEQRDKEEKARREAEIREREEQERIRLEQEAEEKRRQAESEIEMKKQADQTMILFDQEAAVADTTKKPETREGYEIIVTHQAAFVQIFTLWFEREGKNLSLDKMGKTSLNQMKAFCEKLALKENVKIESKFLQYKETFKAVNRKAS